MGFFNGLVLAAPDRILFNVDADNPKCYSGSGTTVYDSISGTSLSLNNGASYSSPGFVFDGTNDGLKASAVISGMDFQFTDEFTLEAVVRVKETGAGFIINNRGVTNGTQNYRGWYMMTENSSPTTRIKAGLGFHQGGYVWMSTACSAADFTNIMYNKWCHVVYSYGGNGLNAKLYLNGVDKSDTNPNSDTSSIYDGAYEAVALPYDSDNLISIGVDSYNDSTYAAYADIAITRVYNVALTEAEIKKNFGAVRGRFGL